MKSTHFRRLPLAALLSLALGAAFAQETPPAPAEGAASAARPGGAPAATPEVEPKAFDKVITKDAKSQKGLVTVHQVKTKLYFEIPKALLGKQLLMVANATSVPSDVDHVGKALNQEVVRFFQKGNKVYFQAVDHAFAMDSARPNAEAVQNSQRDAILASFNVEAFAADGSPVIEVSRLFQAEVGDFSARRMVKGTGLDAQRSYVDNARAFAGSVRIDAVHTYSAPQMLNGPFGPQPAPAGWPARSATFNIAYNLVELPEKAMMPRLMDDRVGYFYVGRTDYGHDRHTIERERLITRWRLEKKDPNAALSEPVKPIVWYIDKSTPTAMVSYVKRGIEAWNVAFEAAGFKNAVQARPFPTKEEDPEFDPEDVRYSIIRWVPSSIPNAYGPHLSDPRSGEILNANIVMYHNIQKILREWYIMQAGAVDVRAQSLPLPDDLMGDLVAMVVTHEVGHSLGFQHNQKASSQYPFEKLRDAKWLKEMGHVSSIMDYSRMNYLVQPEDKIDPALLIPKIGPYDVFATKWGYAPIPSAKTPAAEKPTLDAWARVQDDTPWLRFQAPQNGDYGTVMEAVGDADAVSATQLGTKNLQRIVKNLPKMAIRAGETDRDLSDLYKGVWGQWTRELGHVAALVGGYDHRVKTGSQAGAVSTPASKAQQARAVAFLSEQLFAGYPQWILEPKVLERLPVGVGPGLVVSAQRGLLGSLLSGDRLSRMHTQEQAYGDKAYRVEQLLADLRAGVLSELKTGVTPNGQRRNLQRSYVDVLTAKLSDGSSYDDGRAAIRAEVKSLNKQFADKARAAGDAVTKAHWDELADQTAKALDPLSAARAQGGRPQAMQQGLHDPFAHGEQEEGCWTQH
ncbi:zinc-dependent metalloprotease [Pelomonas sp. SE-A7]|uniref:zinc-dependent metalloprotease n=1 Tax=Pelomonas sp. SE-A7 TaxID=3054953 RepID=UPI00259CCC2D|nr:zinc-dependent metalloprotease [Pelomonas sp. SE-A7]MDM4768434.1 zinc-dependent metalloprotease [Pelomonas sp. SE-A7]